MPRTDKPKLVPTIDPAVTYLGISAIDLTADSAHTTPSLDGRIKVRLIGLSPGSIQKMEALIAELKRQRRGVA